jgi:hypothetical protein
VGTVVSLASYTSDHSAFELEALERRAKVGAPCQQSRVRADHDELALGPRHSNVESTKVFQEASNLSLRVASDEGENYRVLIATLIAVDSADFQALCFPHLYIRVLIEEA